MGASSSHQEERMLSMHACSFEQPLPERELPKAVRDWSAPRKCFGKDVVIRVQRAFARWAKGWQESALNEAHADARDLQDQPLPLAHQAAVGVGPPPRSECAEDPLCLLTACRCQGGVEAIDQAHPRLEIGLLERRRWGGSACVVTPCHGDYASW